MEKILYSCYFLSCDYFFHVKQVVEGQLKASSEEVNQVREQLDAKVASHQIGVEQLEQSVARARQEVAALTAQLSQVQRERVSYQTQAVELRTALHTALGQLKVSLKCHMCQLPDLPFYLF